MVYSIYNNVFPTSPLLRPHGKYKIQTATLSMTFLKHVGESNPHVQFLYSPQTNFNHTRGQVSGSMKSGTINANVQPPNTPFYISTTQLMMKIMNDQP